MFHKSTVARLETISGAQAKTPALWGFRRRAAPEEAVAPAPAASKDAAFEPDTLADGFETFGRSSLQLGGLHRDQQWVGAWGGRC